MIGRNIARYHVTAKLGQGGMGAVWKAQDKLLGRTVALKLLPEGMASSADARRRFLREARSASSLDHPGIARVYDAGEAEGQFYIACSYVEGATLAQRLGGRPMSIPEAVRIARAVAAALGHAHGRGIVHRDVSSSNVMLGSDGHVTVLDFGLAKSIRDASTRITATDTALGTVAYMAPEVALGREADARSDLYGLGAVLYEMITGHPPFVAERPEAVLYGAVHEHPRSPRTERPDVPAALDGVVLRLLAKDPAERSTGAEDLEVELAAIEASLTGVAPVFAPPKNGGRLGAGAGARGGEVPDVKCLAVIPFEDSSAAPASGRAQALARGLADVASARLARVPGIQVIAPSAVGEAGGAAHAIEAARALGANLALLGSIQRVGRRLRIAFSLCDVAAGLQLGGETLDGDTKDLLALEDRFVRAVFETLELHGATAPAGVLDRPGDPAAHEHYLQALGYLQRYENEASVDGAIALLERLRGRDGQAPIEAALGRAYLHKYRLTLDRHWQAEAEQACARALASDPASPEVQVTLGQLHTVVGRTRDAVREFRRALEIRRDDADAHLGLAMAYQSAGQYARAERSCAAAIGLRPRSWAGYNRLGVALFMQGRYDDAAEQWRRVVELAPDNARGHYNLAAAFYHMGRTGEAAAAYERSIEIQPTGAAYAGLGTIHFFAGDYAKAAALFEKGAALKPFDPAKWGNLADAYRWMPGLEEKAEAAYDQAIRLAREQLDLNPSDGGAWVELAGWLAKRGSTREALTALRRGLARGGKDVACMVEAAHVYQLAGDTERAVRWFERAVKHGYDTEELERDPELASLRRHPRVRQILKDGRRG